MAMDGIAQERSILEWDESEVHAWLSSLGYPQYETALRENNISGDVLCMIDAEGLKAIGIPTVGQRLAILKAIYQTKLAHQVPIEADDYVPPSEAQDREITMEKLYDIVKDQSQRLQALEEENKRLGEHLQGIVDDYSHLQTPQASQDSSLRRQASFKWAQFRKPDGAVESPNPSPQRLEHDIAPLQRHTPNEVQISPVERSRMQQISAQDSPGSSQGLPKSHRTENTEAYKSFKLTLDDPTWKVLPAALKKYRINNDSWQNYAMFICYESGGNRIERCLSYDEKPLLLFQKLKEAHKKPVFMLKHIKDIRSPIVVAQQKHAARKASQSEAANNTGQVNNGHTKKASVGVSSSGGGSRAVRPPRLEVNDLTATPVLSGVSPQPGWLDVITSGTSAVDEVNMVSSAASWSSSATLLGGEAGVSQPAPPPGMSYAAAIYPYMAEQDDEFDVVVGDAFIILSRARGWWVVQRDPTGSGILDPDTSKQGWVPAGCLLEINVPVATAIAEANAAKAAASGSLPSSPLSKTRILPLSIISTSFPGIALMDYQSKGEEELDLMKDDALRVFKRYNHWSYVVKEDGGERGWVPSWFIGKVSNQSTGPSTPSSSMPISAATITLETENVGQTQVSPMSSAFPPNQRTVI